MEKEDSPFGQRPYGGCYDPIQRAEETAAVVCRGALRKYYRFRPARFYGGIATADCIGCCLKCLFCWSWPKVIRPDAYGRFYSPEEVAGNLTDIARKKGFDKMRISGNEPTIARAHLINVLELVPKDILFILETNGILIGHDKTYSHDLARYENIHVRVSIKGCNEKEFSRLTGAEPTGFNLQIKALKNLSETGVKAHPAAMVSFSTIDDIEALQKKLGSIDRAFEDMEMEELALYGDVEKRLKKAGIRYQYPHDGISS